MNEARRKGQQYDIQASNIRAQGIEQRGANTANIITSAFNGASQVAQVAMNNYAQSQMRKDAPMLEKGLQNLADEYNNTDNPNAYQDFLDAREAYFNEYLGDKSAIYKGMFNQQFRSSYEDSSYKYFDEKFTTSLYNKNLTNATEIMNGSISAYASDGIDGLAKYNNTTIYKTVADENGIHVVEEEVNLNNLWDTDTDDEKTNEFNTLLNIQYAAASLTMDMDKAKAYVTQNIPSIESELMKNEMLDYASKLIEDPDMSKEHVKNAVKSMYGPESEDEAFRYKTPYTNRTMTASEVISYKSIADSSIDTMWAEKVEQESAKFYADVLPKVIEAQNDDIEMTEEVFDTILENNGIDLRFVDSIKKTYSDTFRRNETMQDLREWFKNGTPSDALTSEMKKYVDFDYEKGEWSYNSSAGWGLISGGVINLDQYIFNAELDAQQTEYAKSELAEYERMSIALLDDLFDYNDEIEGRYKALLTGDETDDERIEKREQARLEYQKEARQHLENATNLGVSSSMADYNISIYKASLTRKESALEEASVNSLLSEADEQVAPYVQMSKEYYDFIYGYPKAGNRYQEQYDMRVNESMTDEEISEVRQEIEAEASENMITLRDGITSAGRNLSTENDIISSYANSLKGRQSADASSQALASKLSKELSDDEKSQLGQQIIADEQVYDSMETEYVMATTSTYERYSTASLGINKAANGALAEMNSLYRQYYGADFDYKTFISEDPLALIEYYIQGTKKTYDDVVAEITSNAEKNGTTYYEEYLSLLGGIGDKTQNEYDMTHLMMENVASYLWTAGTPDGAQYNSPDEYINGMAHYYINNGYLDDMCSYKQGIEQKKAIYNGDIFKDGLPKDFSSTAWKNLQSENIKESVEKGIKDKTQKIAEMIQNRADAVTPHYAGFGVKGVLDQIGTPNPDGTPIDYTAIRNAVVSSNQYTSEEKQLVMWATGSDIAKMVLGIVYGKQTSDVLGDTGMSNFTSSGGTDRYGDVVDWLDSLPAVIQDGATVELLKWVKNNENRFGNDYGTWTRELSNYVNYASEVASDWFVDMCTDASGQAISFASSKGEQYSNDYKNVIKTAGRDFNSPVNTVYGLSDMFTRWVNGDIALTGNLNEVDLFSISEYTDDDERIKMSLNVAASILGQSGKMYDGKTIKAITDEMMKSMFYSSGDTIGEFKEGNSVAEQNATEYGLITSLASLIYNESVAVSTIRSNWGDTETKNYESFIGTPQRVEGDGTIVTNRGARLSVGYDENGKQTITLVPKDLKGGSGGMDISELSMDKIIVWLSNELSSRASKDETFRTAKGNYSRSKVNPTYDTMQNDESYMKSLGGRTPSSDTYDRFYWQAMMIAGLHAGDNINLDGLHLVKDENGGIQLDPEYYGQYLTDIPTLYSGISLNGADLRYDISLNSDATFKSKYPMTTGYVDGNVILPVIESAAKSLSGYEYNESQSKSKTGRAAELIDEAFPVMPTWNYTM